MRAAIFNFLSLNVLNTHPAVYWALAAVWISLCVSAFHSLQSQEISAGSRALWVGVILFLPIIGLAVYSVFCLFKADWGFLKPLFQSRSEAVKAVVQPGKRR